MTHSCGGASAPLLLCLVRGLVGSPRQTQMQGVKLLRKSFRRYICLSFVLLLLAACLPWPAFAVDPVSAGVMANAFAQAIAAYGASNGVAMTFDVASSDGIGESVHELWKQFRDGTQSADDYATLAAALFPELYYKAATVVAGASDVYTVGYNISSTYAEEFDNFYNWLLSGPAEMVQVDNQYYQFSQAQIGSSADPIRVLSFNTLSDYELPFGDPGWTWTQTYDAASTAWVYDYGSYTRTYRFSAYTPNDVPVYAFLYYENSSILSGAVTSDSNNRFYITNKFSSDSTASGNTYRQWSTYNDGLSYYQGTTGIPNPEGTSPSVSIQWAVFPSWQAAYSYVSGQIADPTASESVGVKAYSNTGVASFPDTTDPNYDATHRAKQIPVSEPWDDALYGDGSGTLTDAQSEAIADAVGDTLVGDKSITLAGTDEVTDDPGTDDPPSTDPDDYAVPGLAEIFPFCIPFDIYNFLSALAAEPVAPHFTCTLQFPQAIGGARTIDLDFDNPTFNQLAQLLRLLELLAFIVGLALLTRSMFIRG